MLDTTALTPLIYGRVKPHIYAFETNTVPNYLKVGDTYRPVALRLEEWKNIGYENLIKRVDEEALVDSDIFFRDYSVHKHLMDRQHLHQITDSERRELSKTHNNIHISTEFFLDATASNVKRAIDAIKESFQNNRNEYTFYDMIAPKKALNIDYERNENWEPRDNQKDVIKAFLKAWKAGRTNLLMFAVMRFGKSFTALCCAKEMNAKLVVVVCGKTDVMDEWKQNVQRPRLLDGYHFLTTNNLYEKNIISSYLKSGKRVVLFLTLQDLQGNTIKERHKDLFALNDAGRIDLLIVDETHYAARGVELGRVLINKTDVKREGGAYETTLNTLLEETKVFKSKIRVHLSGTPYRILLGGEFEDIDIISKIRYEDIAQAKEKWDHDNPDAEEWDNPYYGFPQMIRFAFNLTESSCKRIKQLNNNDTASGLNDLFKTYSLKKDSNNEYKKFVNEQEVINLLSAIDGTKEDNNIFSFLKYDKIQEGKMCRHIVMVLPWRASCDAMESILQKHIFNLLNDSNYKILNIAGLDINPEFDANNPDHVENVKRAITECETLNTKTITLTVGRMLTGCTVPEWDTMIMFRNTDSPELYDQAIYRLQSPYIRTIESQDGRVIKRNMKPQTLLVDFDPIRMFQLQHKRALITEINDRKRGNEFLLQQISKELSYSPIICINKDKLQQVRPSDITDEIRKYNNNKSIVDETHDISIDERLLRDDLFRSLIQQEKKLDAKGGVFMLKPHESENETEIELEETTVQSAANRKQPMSPTKGEDELNGLKKKMLTIYFKILLYTFLSEHDEKTLSDVVKHIEEDDECYRIAKNIQLDVEILKMLLKAVHPSVLNELENKIFNISDLSSDKNADVQTAMKRFARISDSEIITPEFIAMDMIAVLPEEITAQSRFLNIAGKTGEFEYAIIQRYGDTVKNNIYTIPTSSVTYECTRKMFKLMGIPLSNIIKNKYSYNLIESEQKETTIQLVKEMKIDAIVGNPPYQENISTNTANSSLSKQLFPSFIRIVHEMEPLCATLITPSRWFKGDAQDKSFIKLRDFIRQNNHISKIVHYPDSGNIFNSAVIKGGVNYFLYQKGYDGPVSFTNCSKTGNVIQQRPLFEEGMEVIFENCSEYELIQKVTSYDFVPLTTITTGRNAFGVIGRPDIIKQISHEVPINNGVKLRCKNNIIRWTERKYITKSIDILDKYKVFISKSAGDPAKDNKIIGQAYVATPNEACTDSLISIGCFETKQEAINLQKYLSTKFLRFLVGILKISQNVTQIVYRFVPLQDFTMASDIEWNKSISEIDADLYAKYHLTPAEIHLIESIIKPME